MSTKKWDAKSRGTSFGYAFFIFILKNLGFRFTYFISNFVVFYFIIFVPKAFKAIFYYFRRIQKYSFFKSILSIYKNYLIFAKILIDKLSLFSGVSSKFSFNFQGEEHIRSAQELKRGVFLIGAHVGNWEIAGNLLERLDSKINLVMFKSQSERLSSIMKNRNNKGLKIIAVNDGLSHILQIKNAVENNEIVCFLADRYVKNDNIRKIDFMGQKAYFPIGLYKLAIKLRVPINYVFAFKESLFYYNFFASQYYLPKQHSNNKDLDKEADYLAHKFVDNLEKKIKMYPLQWFNYYDFWDKL